MNIVEKVSLRNFRCYDEFELDCNRATSLIVGENGRHCAENLLRVWIERL